MSRTLFLTINVNIITNSINYITSILPSLSSTFHGFHHQECHELQSIKNPKKCHELYDQQCHELCYQQCHEIYQRRWLCHTNVTNCCMFSRHVTHQTFFICDVTDQYYHKLKQRKRLCVFVCVCMCVYACVCMCV